MSAWLTIVAAGIATFALRFTPARLLAGRPVSARWEQALDFIGPAAFTALAAPALVVAPATATPALARLAAVVVTVAVARATRSTAAALAVGMPTFWLLAALAAAG